MRCIRLRELRLPGQLSDRHQPSDFPMWTYRLRSEILLKIAKSLGQCLLERLAPFIVVKVFDIAQMAEVKGNICVNLSDQYHLAPESVRNTDFIKDVCIPSGAVTNYHEGPVY